MSMLIRPRFPVVSNSRVSSQKRWRASGGVRSRGWACLSMCLAALMIWTATLAWTPCAQAADVRAHKAEAKVEVEKAQLHYKLGRFEEALKSYTRAFELYEAPALLFNIGQCHKNLQQFDRAVFFFEGYLREEVDADKRAFAEELLATSRIQLERQRAAALRPGPPAPPDFTPPSVKPPMPPVGDSALAPDRAPVSKAERDLPLTAVAPAPAAPILVDKPKTETSSESEPLLHKWWFWTAVGGTAALIATGAIVYANTGTTTTILPTGTVGTLDRR